MSGVEADDFLDKLTGKEMEIAERKAGVAITSLQDPYVPKSGLFGAMAWVLKKRDEPTLKYDDFMETTGFPVWEEILGLDDDENPTEGDSEPNKPNEKRDSASAPE